MSDLLELASAFLRDEVAPRANAMDADPEALRQGLDGLCRLGLMALRRSARYGGPELSEATFREFQERVARASGALAFLQTQHQSAVAMIGRSDNEALKERVLPLAHDGRFLCAIGFSQLRRAGPPMLRAERTPVGYRLNGHLPWITGYGFFPDLLVGAELPSREAVFGVIPFQAGPGVTIGPTMRLAAMEAAQTVTMDLDGLDLPEEAVAFVRPPRWIDTNDLINITVQGFFAIGCARAGLDILLAQSETKPLPFIREAYDRLSAELDACRDRLAASQAHGEETTEERLRLRAHAIDLAVRCAHAAIAASSGAANSVNHPAQRVYREALVYTVSAQTTAIMQATLERLAPG